MKPDFNIHEVATKLDKTTVLEYIMHSYKLIPKSLITAYTDVSFSFAYSYNKLDFFTCLDCFVTVIDDGRGKNSVWGMPISIDGDFRKAINCLVDLVENNVMVLNCSEDTLNAIKLQDKSAYKTIVDRSEVFKWVQYYAKSDDYPIGLPGSDLKQFRRVWNNEAYQNLTRIVVTSAKDITDKMQKDIIGMMKAWGGVKKENLKKVYYLHNVANALPYNVSKLPDCINFKLIMLYDKDDLICYSITEMSQEGHVYTVEGKRNLDRLEFSDINKFIHLVEIEEWRKECESFTIELGRGNQHFDKNVSVKHVKALPLLDKANPIFSESLNKAKLLLRPFYANLSVRFNGYKFQKKLKKEDIVTKPKRKRLF